MRTCDCCSKKFLGGGCFLQHYNDTTTDFCSRYCFEKKFRYYAQQCVEDAESTLVYNLINNITCPLIKRYYNTRKIFFRACLNDITTEQLKKIKSLADDAMINILEDFNEEVQSGNETEQDYLDEAEFLKTRSRFMTVMIEVLGK